MISSRGAYWSQHDAESHAHRFTCRELGAALGCCTSASEAVQYSLAVTIFVLPSFSLLQRDRRVKSWTAAKRGRAAMQLKLLQAKQEETQGAIEEEKEENKK